MPQLTKEITINSATIPIAFDVEYSLGNTKLDVGADFLEQLGPWTQEYYQDKTELHGRIDEPSFEKLTDTAVLLDGDLPSFIKKKAHNSYGDLIYDIDMTAKIVCKTETRKQIKIVETDYRTFAADVKTRVYFIGKINENVFACLDKQLDEKIKKWSQEGCPESSGFDEFVPFGCNGCTVIMEMSSLGKIKTQIRRARTEIMLGKCLALFPIVAIFLGFIPTMVVIPMLWTLLKNNFSSRNELFDRFLVIALLVVLSFLWSLPVAIELAKAYVQSQNDAFVGWTVFFSGLPGMFAYYRVLDELVGVCPI